MSKFEDRFASGLRQLKNYLGDTLTYTNTQTGESEDFLMIPNEFVGAVDSFARKLFSFAASDLTVATEPGRGHLITDSFGTWIIVDVRIDDAGGYEVRADIAQEVT